MEDPRPAWMAVLPKPATCKRIAVRLSRTTTPRPDPQSGQDCRHLPAICRQRPSGGPATARTPVLFFYPLRVPHLSRITRCANAPKSHARDRTRRFVALLLVARRVEIACERGARSKFIIIYTNALDALPIDTKYPTSICLYRDR